jgi:small-conductance mechanosensitive channel
MKKDVWKYGLLSGLALAIMMAITVPFEHHTSERWAMVIGYTTMVLSFLIVFVGVKHYRDTECGGSISFGRALAAGVLMMLISCSCYVAMWEALNATVEKNFAHEYSAALVKRAQNSGLQGAALERKIAEARKFEAMYSNPVYSAAITLLEPLPVGIVMALVTAGILRRKPEDGMAAIATPEALES